MGWLLVGECKPADTLLISKYAPDLAKDWFYVWLNRYHWVPLIVLALLLLGIAVFQFCFGASASESSLIFTLRG
jgi:fatty-acid desaturase